MIVRRLTTRFSEQAMLGEAPGDGVDYYRDIREVRSPDLWHLPILVTAVGVLGQVIGAKVSLSRSQHREADGGPSPLIDIAYRCEPPIELDPDRPAHTLDETARAIAAHAVKCLATIEECGPVYKLELETEVTGEQLFGPSVADQPKELE